jgi:hypothetical protein
MLDEEHFYWEKATPRKKYDLQINAGIFEDGKLKYIKNTDWDSSFFALKTTEIVADDADDLPF